MQDSCPSFFQEMANVIVFHRKKSHLNRAELAEIAGVGKTVIFDLEHAKQTVRLDTLAKVLYALNIKLELTGPLMKYYREASNAKS